MEFVRFIILILFVVAIVFVAQAFNLEKYPLLEEKFGDTVIGMGMKFMSLSGIIFLILGASYLIYPRDSHVRTMVSNTIIKIMGFCSVVGMLIVCVGIVNEIINMP